MKILIFPFFMFLVTASVCAQTKEDAEQKLTNHTLKVKEHALKIRYGESRTHKEHVRNSDEIGKHLDSAVTEHENLKKKIPKRYRKDVVKNTSIVEKQHADAKKHHEALHSELSKGKHNEMAVRHHATRIHASLEKAEKEGEIIKAKTEK